MGEFKDLTGIKFNRLTVLELLDQTAKIDNCKKRYWLCQCECESKTIKSISEYSLVRGKIKSCGCIGREKTIERNKQNTVRNKPFYKRLYSIYDGMRKRCYKENHDNYHIYGGRGIIICDEWLNSFINFYDWALANGYQDDLTIDRINVNGNYEPDNCRWATWEEQYNNRRDTVYITLDGEEKTLAEWSKISGLSRTVLWQRYKNLGLATKEELFKPLQKIVKVIHNGEEKTLAQLSEETGIDTRTLHWRYKQGYQNDELTRPVGRWYGHEKPEKKPERKK